MKTKNLRVSLFSLLFLSLNLLTSCSDNNSNNKQTSQNEKLAGIWSLKKVSGGFEGVDVVYESGSVSWEFIPETNVLTVVSTIVNNGPQSIYLPLQNGSYNYTLTEVNGKTYIKIEGYQIFENGEYGQYEITNLGELIINQSLGSAANANDVFVLSFD